MRRSLVSKVGAGIVGIVIAAVIDTVVFQIVLTQFLSDYIKLIDQNFSILSLSFFYRLLTFALWSLFYVGFGLRLQLQSAGRSIEKAEASLRQSELTRLQAQLQPHFLFNALTCILACRHDPDAVERVTIGLAEHLRFCMQPQIGFSPLNRELTALESYLDVERMRFGERLACRVSCTPVARETVVPPMVLSPLLENALKHGMQTCGDRLEIDVDCRILDQKLVLSVRNSGHWIPPEQSTRRGMGLENLKERMELLQIPDFSLEYSTADGSVLACIRLPIKCETAQTMSV
jgi:LytS/YehU family sensor histidine kinase